MVRHGVLWRKSSGVKASESDRRFVERIFGVAATCREKGIGELDYRTCFQAPLAGRPASSLLITTARSVVA
jgi:hypothetical protein